MKALRGLAALVLLAFAAPALAQQQPVNVGATANNGGGDSLRTAYQKLNANDTNLFARVGALESIGYSFQPLNYRLTALSSGTIDGVVIGGSIPSPGSFSSLSIAGTTINGVGTTAGTVAAGNDSRLVAAVPSSRQVLAGPGLVGGGNLGSDITVSLPATGVAAGSYANPSLTVDAYGRVTSAASSVSATTMSVPIRQTVLSGPIASGAPSFLPATTSGLSIATQNVSSSTPLIATVAKGFGANGTVDLVGTATTNLTFSLVANTTNYLVAGVMNGSLSAIGSLTLVPKYQYGGTIDTTNGQYTFDFQAMQGWVGNGSTIISVNYIIIGEATTSSSAVTSSAAYAYQGVYDSGWTAGLPTNLATPIHNLGIQPLARRMIAENTTAENGYSVGDRITSDSGIMAAQQNFVTPISIVTTRLSSTILQGGAGWATINKTSALSAQMTPANWRWKFVVQRGW